MSISPHNQQIKKLSNPQKCFGDAGHRSPYLSHAKRALYQLRYIPVLFKLRASFWTQFMKCVSICNEVSISPHNQQIKNNCRILKNVLEMRGIDPRTSRMLSERSTIWAISPYSSSFELASEHNSWKTGFRFVTSCQFLPIINKTDESYRILKNVLEMRGIDPRTSRMISKRSTIWATSPYSSSFKLALNKTHEISVFHL